MPANPLQPTKVAIVTTTAEYPGRHGLKRDGGGDNFMRSFLMGRYKKPCPMCGRRKCPGHRARRV